MSVPSCQVEPLVSQRHQPALLCSVPFNFQDSCSCSRFCQAEGMWDGDTNGEGALDWQTTSDACRDFHRELIWETAEVPRFRHSLTLSAEQYRLHPDIGAAKDIAKPGGFRRNHLGLRDALVPSRDSADLTSSDRSGPSPDHPFAPLTVQMNRRGFSNVFLARLDQIYTHSVERQLSAQEKREAKSRRRKVLACVLAVYLFQSTSSGSALLSSYLATSPEGQRLGPITVGIIFAACDRRNSPALYTYV